MVTSLIAFKRQLSNSDFENLCFEFWKVFGIWYFAIHLNEYLSWKDLQWHTGEGNDAIEKPHLNSHFNIQCVKILWSLGRIGYWDSCWNYLTLFYIGVIHILRNVAGEGGWLAKALL